MLRGLLVAMAMGTCHALSITTQQTSNKSKEWPKELHSLMFKIFDASSPISVLPARKGRTEEKEKDMNSLLETIFNTTPPTAVSTPSANINDDKEDINSFFETVFGAPTSRAPSANDRLEEKDEEPSPLLDTIFGPSTSATTSAPSANANKGASDDGKKSIEISLEEIFG